MRGKKKLTIMIIAGEYDRAETMLNNIIARRIIRYKRFVKNEKRLWQKLENLHSHYAPYYSLMDREMPDRFENLTGDLIQQWFDYYKGQIREFRVS